ncbi:MAG: hypothetical protein AAGH48_04200 [Pseudomonadota bacterium]
MRRFLTGLAAAFGLIGASSASAADGVKIDDVITATATVGAPAEVVEQAEDLIVLRSQSDRGLIYITFMSRCGQGLAELSNAALRERTCQQLSFVVIFRKGINKAVRLTPAMMNIWNSRKVGQAFIDDEGNIVLQHYIFAPDGLSLGNLRRNVVFWNGLAAEFGGFLVSLRPQSPGAGVQAKIQKNSSNNSVVRATMGSAASSPFGYKPPVNGPEAVRGMLESEPR